MITEKRKCCIQWRLYICNNSNIIYRIKKKAAQGKSTGKEKQIWPLNSEGPQNYSSNGRVKTLHMYSFYKNTLTFDCCFSNMSLLRFSWEDAAEHVFWQEGPGWPLVWMPSTQQSLGSGLYTPNSRLHPLIMLSSTEDHWDFLWGSF